MAGPGALGRGSDHRLLWVRAGPVGHWPLVERGLICSIVAAPRAKQMLVADSSATSANRRPPPSALPPAAESTVAASARLVSRAVCLAEWHDVLGDSWCGHPRWAGCSQAFPVPGGALVRTRRCRWWCTSPARRLPPVPDTWSWGWDRWCRPGAGLAGDLLEEALRGG